VTLRESDGLSLNLGGEGNVLSTAQDAVIELDGALRVTNSSNTFSDVLEGVTFDAVKVDADPVSIEVKRDTDSQVDAFKTFVDSYNDVVGFINKKVRPSSIGARSDLINDPTMRTVRRQLSTLLQTSVENNSEFSNLAQLGFETKQDGTLKLDESDLKDALSKDYKGALSIFTKESGGLAEQYESTIKDMLDTDGLLDSRTDSLNDRIKGLNKSIDRQNTRVDAYEARLKAQFLAMETAIQRLNTQSSSLNGQIGIYQR